MVALNRPSMPPPVPPAAPAPGLSVILRPFSAVMASASLPKPQSSNATCSGFAPFCGANTAAPSVPVRGIGDVACQYDRDVSHVVGNLGVVDAGKPGSAPPPSGNSQSSASRKRWPSARAQCRRRWWRCRPIQVRCVPLRRRSRRESARRCRKWTPPTDRGRRGDALDAARRSQLDHRGARILSIVRCSETALAKESISCDDRPAQRVMRVLRSQFAAGCLDQRVGQSLAAIGQRHHAAFGAGIAGRHAPAYRLSHGLRGSGFLERIRCQQIPHGQR